MVTSVTEQSSTNLNFCRYDSRHCTMPNDEREFKMADTKPPFRISTLGLDQTNSDRVTEVDIPKITRGMGSGSPSAVRHRGMTLKDGHADDVVLLRIRDSTDAGVVISVILHR
jgi:hypothetical protein